MIIISPSKRQHDPIYKYGLDSPPMMDKTKKLISILSQLTEKELAKMLNIKPEMAKKVYQQYQNLDKGIEGSMEAIYLYQGDVFKSLDVQSLDNDALSYLQDNLRIISPLYSLIKPLDGIWPYRLEMVSKVPNVPMLKDYWQDIKTMIKKEDYIFNLASKEYASCVSSDYKNKWIDIVIEDKKPSGKYQVIAVKAKRIRGEILRFMAMNQVKEPQELSEFKHDEYQFSEESSSLRRVVFRSG